MQLKDRIKRQAGEMLREETGHVRVSRPVDRAIIALISLSWALFQLALPRIIILDSTTVRAVHLAFASALVYLSFPMLKSRSKDIRFLHSLSKIPAIDYVLAVAAALAALYIVFDWEGISLRAGRPILRDIIVSVAVIFFVLEAARRSIGIPMVIIAILFTLYAFLGPHLPYFMAYRGVSVTKYLSQIVLSTEGIYGIPLDVSAQTVFLFVLFGALLERFGAGQFFNDLAISLLGRYKGGPAKASVVSSGLTGLVSGSSIANVVTTGTFTIPLMKKVGYPAKTAAATEVAASTNGQLMPPIMGAAAFIIAEYLGKGYLEVVRAAFLPAFVSYLALFYITHLEASKLGMAGLPPEEVPSFRKVLAGGFYHLIPLVILIYELAVLRHTPNLSVFNAILVLFVVVVIRETITALRTKKRFLVSAWETLRTIGEGMIFGTKNMVPVAMATATAGIIVGIVNMGIGSMIVQMVEHLSMGNVFLLLLITAIVSLIIGMGLPTTATYIVMASITVPVITKLGGNVGLVIPAIAAHLFCFYFGILADDTPPVGLAAYAASAIADSDPIATGIKGFSYDLRTAVIPFMFILNAELLLIGVHGVFQVLFVFASATVGMLAFTNLVQGWFITRNHWLESPFFVLVSIACFLPGRTAEFLGIAQDWKYLVYIIGFAIYGMIFLSQRTRISRDGTGAETA